MTTQPADDVIDSTAIPVTGNTHETAIEVAPASPLTLGVMPLETPQDAIKLASSIADVLKDVIKQRNLITIIQGREHVNVEGWTTLLAMIGVSVREVSELTKRYEDGSWEATVELVRVANGQPIVIGRASALCGVDEKDKKGNLTWGARAEFARRSMAITRATGKAARLNYSWIMNLAGFEVTPAEELDNLHDPEPFWTEVQDMEKFWTYTNSLGLERDEVWAALEVKTNLRQFHGEKPEAMGRLKAFAAAKALVLARDIIGENVEAVMADIAEENEQAEITSGVDAYYGSSDTD